MKKHAKNANSPKSPHAKLSTISRVENEVDHEQPRSESPQTAEYSEVNAVGGFGGKNTSKPDPWDGDTDQEFKIGPNASRGYMANAGDKVWRKILKALQVMRDDDDSLDDVNDVKQVWTASTTSWQEEDYREYPQGAESCQQAENCRVAQRHGGQIQAIEKRHRVFERYRRI